MSEEKTKKTLMNSFEYQRHNVEQLNDLLAVSNKMVRLMMRTNDNVEKEAIKNGSPINDSSKQLDIIDLFNSSNEEIERKINRIRENIVLVIDMIE